MSICREQERQNNSMYPKSCPTCKFGPCSQSHLLEAEFAAMSDWVQKPEPPQDDAGLVFVTGNVTTNIMRNENLIGAIIAGEFKSLGLDNLTKAELLAIAASME